MTFLDLAIIVADAKQSGAANIKEEIKARLPEDQQTWLSTVIDRMLG